MTRNPPTFDRPGAADFSLAALRIAIAAILIWGAATKLGGDRISRLAEGWRDVGVPLAELMVTMSIGLQLMLGLLLLVGLFARPAGLLNGANFAAAAALSGIFAGAAWWPFALLIVALLHFGARGAGPVSLDAVLNRRRLRLHVGDGSLEGLMAAVGARELRDDGNNPGGSAR